MQMRARIIVALAGVGLCVGLFTVPAEAASTAAQAKKRPVHITWTLKVRPDAGHHTPVLRAHIDGAATRITSLGFVTGEQVWLSQTGKFRDDHNYGVIGLEQSCGKRVNYRGVTFMKNGRNRYSPQTWVLGWSCQKGSKPHVVRWEGQKAPGLNQTCPKGTYKEVVATLTSKTRIVGLGNLHLQLRGGEVMRTWPHMMNGHVAQYLFYLGKNDKVDRRNSEQSFAGRVDIKVKLLTSESVKMRAYCLTA